MRRCLSSGLPRSRPRDKDSRVSDLLGGEEKSRRRERKGNKKGKAANKEENDIKSASTVATRTQSHGGSWIRFRAHESEWPNLRVRESLANCTPTSISHWMRAVPGVWSLNSSSLQLWQQCGLQRPEKAPRRRNTGAGNWPVRGEVHKHRDEGCCRAVRGTSATSYYPRKKRWEEIAFTHL